MEKMLFMQVSDSTWIRAVFHPSLLNGYYLELKLQSYGVDLKGVLMFHDQLSESVSSSEEDSHLCPNCGGRFSNKDEEFAKGFGTRKWPSYGGF